MGLEKQQAQFREAMVTQERVCARLEAALLLDKRAQRAVEEVKPWPRGDAWTLYSDVLQLALEGRDIETVTLEEV